jgi:hypothetical protein
VVTVDIDHCLNSSSSSFLRSWICRDSNWLIRALQVLLARSNANLRAARSSVSSLSPRYPATPASAPFKIATICVSVKRDFFIRTSWKVCQKVLLPNRPGFGKLTPPRVSGGATVPHAHFGRRRATISCRVRKIGCVKSLRCRDHGRARPELPRKNPCNADRPPTSKCTILARHERVIYGRRQQCATIPLPRYRNGSFCRDRPSA